MQRPGVALQLAAFILITFAVSAVQEYRITADGGMHALADLLLLMCIPGTVGVVLSLAFGAD